MDKFWISGYLIFENGGSNWLSMQRLAIKTNKHKLIKHAKSQQWLARVNANQLAYQWAGIY